MYKNFNDRWVRLTSINFDPAAQEARKRSFLEQYTHRDCSLSWKQFYLHENSYRHCWTSFTMVNYRNCDFHIQHFSTRHLHAVSFQINFSHTEIDIMQASYRLSITGNAQRTGRAAGWPVRRRQSSIVGGFLTSVLTAWRNTLPGMRKQHVLEHVCGNWKGKVPKINFSNE